MRTIDLHAHSTASDGTLSPTALVRAARDAGLSAIALTDHDTADGVAEAVAEGARCGVEVVPGIELSASSEAKLHILGYFIDPASPVLVRALDGIRAERLAREEERCRRLTEAGYPVSMEEAAAEATGVIGGAHIARALVKKGYAASVPEVFARFMSPGAVADVSHRTMTGEDAVALIRAAGGVPVAAHLHQTGLSGEALRARLLSLVDAGLAGVEGYYTEYTPAQAAAYRALAAELGLALSGGSDFHGANKPRIHIGRGYGDLSVPYSVLEGLRERIPK